MQITPVNLPPVPPGAQPPQTIVNVLPGIQAQATPPVTGASVTPSPRSEKKQKSRRHGDRDGEGREDPPRDPGRGHNVNISV